MEEKTSTILKTAFEEDVYRGLTDYPKHISSQYFYDKAGDRLFQEIMAMPEYYLTECEFAILERYREEIINLFIREAGAINLIELGAGDGTKTMILLRALEKKGIPFKYIPVDISINALSALKASVEEAFPGIDIEPLQGTYFESLARINTLPEGRNVILFLGSNIGNLLHPQALKFLSGIREAMDHNDLLFIGFDLKKDPRRILEAYNDQAGITEAFNKNLLLRINRELRGDFDPDTFMHWEVYDPESGTARSYLVSRIKQTVTIRDLDLEVHFEPWESLHTEISQKYDRRTIEWLAEQSGFSIAKVFCDPQDRYGNYIFRRKRL